MSGISDQALAFGKMNKFRFNDGNEAQINEFSDGSGLDLYDANFRMYDPQIGRFHQLDPLADISGDNSPYSFALNNPILLEDPLGLAADTVVQLPDLVIYGTAPEPKKSQTCIPCANAQDNGSGTNNAIPTTPSPSNDQVVLIDPSVPPGFTRMPESTPHPELMDYSGFWGQLKYAWTGGVQSGWQYDQYGEPLGPALVDHRHMGIAPIPDMPELPGGGFNLGVFNEALGMAKTTGGDFEGAAAATREFSEANINAEFVAKLKAEGKITKEALLYYERQMKIAISNLGSKAGGAAVQRARLETLQKILSLW